MDQQSVAPSDPVISCHLSSFPSSILISCHVIGCRTWQERSDLERGSIFDTKLDLKNEKKNRSDFECVFRTQATMTLNRFRSYHNCLKATS